MASIDPPPFRIYLLRHAKAVRGDPGQRDFDRGLDDQGYAEAEMIAERAADCGYRPDMVISSTAVRCRQTADAVRRAISETIEPMFVDDLYNGSAEIYLDILSAQRDSRSVMLIGHNPVIEQTLAALIGTSQVSAAIPSGYPTAGLAVLDHQGSGTVWTLTDFLKA
ncbi:histidine phosphatase family protein [Neorhizobium lilium]|uniref:Histidine phosphatase family protein n=1 Tax=Neorhizobium lilium TaxID=2503024 RepID=A0A3S3RQL5_9HYPH|nr:histidine phosphatase family protein [Neorhizobium lilium]RWX75490.1 histidine phosphatase family protein [Neorhizobium lilium]